MSDPVKVPAVAEPLYQAMTPFAAQIEAVRVAHDHPITSAEAERKTTRALGLLANVKSTIEERRVALKAPILQSGKDLDAAAKAILAPVLDLDTKLRQHVLAWKRAEAARIEAEQRAAREENERRIREQREAEEAARRRITEELIQNDHPTREDWDAAQQLAAEAVPAAAPVLAPVPAAAPRTVRTDMGSTGVTKRWTFEVVDPEAVPREFCVPDESAIRKAVNGGLRELPGVRIYAEETLAVRSAR